MKYDEKKGSHFIIFVEKFNNIEGLGLNLQIFGYHLKWIFSQFLPILSDLLMGNCDLFMGNCSMPEAVIVLKGLFWTCNPKVLKLDCVNYYRSC